MHSKISEKQYQQEMMNFIGLSIDRVNILYDPQLLVGGFSLIHILDDNKKKAQILDITGLLTYQNKTNIFQTNISFGKTAEEGKKFIESTKQIKQEIMQKKSKISNITFKQQSTKAIISLSDNLTLTAQSLDSKTRPLSYDDDSLGYTVYYGEKVDEDGDAGYFRFN